MNSPTWLHQWLNAENVVDIASAAKALDSRAALGRLVDLAERADSEPRRPRALSSRAVLAGRSLDLSSFLACGHPACRSRQVDDLFSHVWHYFDEIAVVGPDSHYFLELARARNFKSMERFVLSNAQVLFHVRSRGVEELLVFTPKPPACPHHFSELSAEPSLHLSDGASDRLLDFLLKGGKIERVAAKGGYLYKHPSLNNGSHWVRDSDLTAATDEALIRRVARVVLSAHWLAAASDVFESRALGLPLGAGIDYEMRVVSELRPGITPDDVAFNLELPALKGLHPADLLSLRENERESFEAFRVALRKAAKERIANASAPDAKRIAKEIQDDVIAPSLNAIGRRLAATESLLNRKQAINLGIIGLATTCGVLGQIPLASALFVGATASAAAAHVKAAEEKREIAMDDMYFLWKGQGIHRDEGASLVGFNRQARRAMARKQAHRAQS